MAECYTQKTSAAWNEATSRSNLGLFRQASTSENDDVNDYSNDYDEVASD